ncbi:leucine-rich repeat protein [Oscillospiraceae bacterium Marseille-Q3528]|nr:leucine-rich repeat protein [Oscillospiraceae bacterium Marseille-Q3528]
MKKRWLAAMLGCALFWQQCGSMTLASEMMEPVEVQQEADEVAEENEAQQEEIQEVEFSEEDSEKGEDLEEKTLDKLQETEENVPESEDALAEESILSETISKENASVVATGSCGEDATYTLDEDGLLTITGNGNMDVSQFAGRSDIVAVFIENKDRITLEGTFENCQNLKSFTMSGLGISNLTEKIFSNCKELENVELRVFVSTIPDQAFKGCEKLNKITIPEYITDIAEGAFDGCISLKTAGEMEGGYNIEFAWNLIPGGVSELFKYCESITIPDGTTSICGDAFSKCVNLRKIVIGKDVDYIPEGSFDACKLLKTAGGIGSGCNIEFAWNTVIPGGVSELFKHCESIIIPDTIQEIRMSAFSQSENLRKVVIGKNVQAIGENAFKESTLLKTAGGIGSGCNIELGWEKEIPAYVNNLFKYCENVNIPAGIETIGREAFQNCGNIRKVIIPESIQSILNGAFDGCLLLKTAGKTGSDCDIEIGWKTNIPSPVVSLFQYCERVELPEGIKEIGAYTFSSADKLEKLIIHGELEAISNNAFSQCELLKTAGEIGSDCNIELNFGKKIPSNITGLFKNCVEITIPEGVEQIGDSAFWGCKNLEKVNFPSSLVKIDNSAFMSCDQLNDVILPDNITEIGESAFSGCRNLENIKFPSALKGINSQLLASCNSLKAVVIPDGVNTIGNRAFRDCASLESITLPDSLKTVDYLAFNGCNTLKTAGGIGSGCNIEFGWETEIPSGMGALFKNCESIIVPEGITKIGGEAFYCATKLKTISLPSTLQNINDEAFFSCESLEKVELHEGITSIGARAFYACTSLKELLLPKSLEVIKAAAFGNCKSLSQITIPDSVRNIESSAFSNCTNLQELTLPEGVQEVADNAFSGCTSLTKVSIESEQVSLGANAFLGCTSLKSMSSAGRLALGDSAFDSCTTLETFDCKGGVTAVGAKAFYNCGKLRAITLAEPLSEIRGHAFNGCSSLTEITLPKTVTQIRTYAFHGCKSLKDIYILNGNCKIYSNANTISATAVIHGQAISTAKEYASQYKRKFVALSDDNTGENNGKDDPKADMPEVGKKGDLYDDVLETSGWRYEAIKYVKDHGIMNGISGTRNFAPDEPLTRAMFATIIYRMEGSPKASYSAKFPDVPDGNYFSVPIIWANKAGIINGHSNTGLFGTRENITREDMVVIMYRYCKYKSVATADWADLGQYPDEGEVSGYAKEAVQWAVANGIIKGRSNTGMLDPKGNATRVETAAVIQRFMRNIR